jgi:hypothetical protein
MNDNNDRKDRNEKSPLELKVKRVRTQIASNVKTGAYSLSSANNSIGSSAYTSGALTSGALTSGALTSGALTSGAVSSFGVP